MPAESRTQMIDVAKIDVTNVVDKKLRRFSTEFVHKLATAIRVEGLLTPILIRPNPEKVGRFLLVAGRHRYHAVKKILRWETIEAKVLEGLDEQSARMAAISENLWRSPLTRVQYMLALKEWFAYYQATFPDRVGPGKVGLKRAVAANANRNGTKKRPGVHNEPLAEGQVARSESDDAPEPEPTAPEPTTESDTDCQRLAASNFAKYVAETTGKSLGTAKRDVRIARAFDEDQLEAFAQMRVGLVEAETIALIADKTQRDAIVNLIATGMDARDAIAEVRRPEDGVIKLSNGKTVTVVRGDDAQVNGKTDDELTDEEWLEVHCSSIRSRLANKAAFDADAILYRELVDARAAFKSKSKKPLKKAEDASKVHGTFFHTVKRLTLLTHPCDWLVCGRCNGAGEAGGDLLKTRCDGCSGSGYVGQKRES